MVVIRLSRGGAKKRPFYHIVVANKANARDGRFIERLGYYNPMASGKAVELSFDVARAEHWIANGAQASDRVKALIKQYKNQEADTAKSA